MVDFNQQETSLCKWPQEPLTVKEAEYIEAMELLVTVQETIVDSVLELVLEWHRSKEKIGSTEDV
jgi:hypothetical protein